MNVMMCNENALRLFFELRLHILVKIFINMVLDLDPQLNKPSSYFTPANCHNVLTNMVSTPIGPLRDNWTSTYTHIHTIRLNVKM